MTDEKRSLNDETPEQKELRRAEAAKRAVVDKAGSAEARATRQHEMGDAATRA